MDTVSDLELDKLENDLPQLVERLKVAAKGKDCAKIPNDCDDLIKRCLRLKDYKQEKALNLVEQLCGMIPELKSWNVSIKPSSYESLYNSKVCYSLPRIDPQGRRVIMVRLANWNPDEVSFEKLIMSAWTMFQFASYDFIETQRRGLVIVADLLNVTMRQAWSLKVKLILSVMGWMQNGALCRMNAVHVIFHPRIISVVYSTISPFLKEKMKQRIIFHGDDLSSLHKHISPNCLPPCLRDGRREVGLDEDDNFCDMDFHKKLLQQDPFFESWLNKGYPMK